MDQQTFQKAAEMISSAKNILLVPHVRMDCDAMSSAIALFLFLQKMGKRVTAVCSDPVPEAYQFLPSTDIFKHHVEGGNEDLIVTIDATKTPFKDLKWTLEEGKVNIVLSAENGRFSEGDFSFSTSSEGPDLIISLDTADLPQLGKLYEDNSALFRRTPFLNIDHHVSNTNFGSLNLVVITNCSTTETLYDLFPYISEQSKEMIDDDIATLILAGMITDTGSFQHANTTPKALDIAANLIEKGARQQEIIKYLFKTKELSTLRLWGRILSKIQSDPIYRLVWSSVNANDLLETESKSDESEGLIDELLATTPGSEMVLLVREREDGAIATSIRTSSNFINAIDLAAQFGGGGHRQAAGFKIYNRGGKSFEEILGDIITATKNFQAQRLNIAPPQGVLLNSLEEAPLLSHQPEVSLLSESPEVLEIPTQNPFPEPPVPVYAVPPQNIPPLEGFEPPQDYRNEHDQEHFVPEEQIDTTVVPFSQAPEVPFGTEMDNTQVSFGNENISESPVFEMEQMPEEQTPEYSTTPLESFSSPENLDAEMPEFLSPSENFAPEPSFVTDIPQFAETPEIPSFLSEPSPETNIPEYLPQEFSAESMTPDTPTSDALPSFSFQNPDPVYEASSAESAGSEISSLLQQESPTSPFSFSNLLEQQPEETPISAEEIQTVETSAAKTAQESQDFEAFMARMKEGEVKREEASAPETPFAGTEEYFNTKTEQDQQAIIQEIEAERLRATESKNIPSPAPAPITPNEDTNTPKHIFEMFFQKKENTMPPPPAASGHEEVVHGNESIMIGRP
ncbi:MAG: bifunctional oligoribonuclease/PAP phosphatase NrnA [Candidatus Peregrinibacteria bacterium]